MFENKRRSSVTVRLSDFHIPLFACWKQRTCNGLSSVLFSSNTELDLKSRQWSQTTFIKAGQCQKACNVFLDRGGAGISNELMHMDCRPRVSFHSELDINTSIQWMFSRPGRFDDGLWK